MGGSRSRQPRQLRRPFSSKGTFQGDNQNAFAHWRWERLKRKKEVSLWVAKTANLFNCSCPSYTSPTSCLIAPTLPTACLSVRTCSIPPSQKFQPRAKSGNKIVKSDTSSPYPKSRLKCVDFFCHNSKKIPTAQTFPHSRCRQCVFVWSSQLKTQKDCHVIYQSTLPSRAELHFLFHFWWVHILQANQNFIFYHVR